MWYSVPMNDQSPSKLFAASTRSTKPAPSQLISIRLPGELLQRLADVGNQESLSMSDTIRLVLERGLRTTTKKGK